MGVIVVALLGIALAMDALGVTLGIGVNTYVRRERKMKYLISFGFFQFLFSFIGGACGFYIDNYIVSIPNILGSIVMGIVGVVMIIDGLKDKDEGILDKGSMCLIMGISVSIDALVVGFTALHHTGGFLLLFLYSLIIGLITLFICTISFFLCRYIRKISFISKYADFLGGLVLILFALKMLLF